MPKRGENIYKRKDGRWEGRYHKGHIGGKIQYGYVYAKTYKEVKDKLLTRAGSMTKKNNIEGDAFCIQPDVQEMQPESFLGAVKEKSFREIADEWIDFFKPQLKESSNVRYRNILNLYLLPCFGEKQLSDITRSEIVEFSGELLHSGGRNKKGLSPKMVEDILSVQKNIFEYASQIKNYTVIDIKGISVRQSQKPMRILSRYEQEQVSQFLYNNLTLCNLGILLCLYMGLRVGEICALKWGDILFKEQYIYVHQTMQRIQKKEQGDGKTEVIISSPKSDCSIRKIPIPNEIFQLIQNARKPENTFFLTGEEHRYIEPRTMQNRFKAVMKCCGLDAANFHALRHTFATRCVELGFDVKSLSEILGHASVNITLNRYVHPSMDLKQQNMNMLSELITVR